MRSILIPQLISGLVLAAGCAFGAPPGFSPGTQWTMPLVDPLSDVRLLVPVMVHGHGPYLFVIDRDEPHSVVDPEIAADVGVRMRRETRMIDYNDRGHAAFMTELTDVEVGTLTVSLIRVDVPPQRNHFDSDGRRIHGILGRDFLADSLVFGFDRDKGIAWLSTQEAFQPPAGAHIVELSKYTTEGVKVPYFPIVEAKVDGVEVDLHPQFASVVSALAPDQWKQTHVQPIDFSLTLVDAAGTPRQLKQLGVAQQVAVGDLTTANVGFEAYDDRRLIFLRLGGMLGLDFFRPFSVAADWHHRKLYLTPRASDPVATLKERAARWGGEIAACQIPGCAQLTTRAPDNDDPTRPILEVTTDPGVTHDFEIMVRAVDKNGKQLPNIEINMMATQHGLGTKLAPQYLDAKLDIVDVSPFPRRCPELWPCVLLESPTPP